MIAFEQAREDQEDARAEHLARDHDRVLPDLRDEIPGAACCKLISPISKNVINWL